MLGPQRGAHRDYVTLDGVWGFRADPDGTAGPHAEPTHGIAVPGSWNEQLAESGFMDYVGAVWLTTEVVVPAAFAARRIVLRFGSAGYTAEVFANGERVGEGRLPYLPFEADVTGVATPGEAMRVAVRVSNAEGPDGITPGITREAYGPLGIEGKEYYPATRPDFYPYGGLHRPVHLIARPTDGIDAVRVRTDVADGRASVTVEADGMGELSAELSLRDEPVAAGQGTGAVTLDVPTPSLWSPAGPTLYDLTLHLHRDGGPVDEWRQAIGIRTVRTEGTALLLNDEPVFLRGFGRHEDASVSGRGLNLPVMVKDFGLMAWCGANSFRTSHYPYAEEQLDWADRHGVLVVSELACVNLDFRSVTDATRANHLAGLEAQVARDRNHPSVVMWSLANEPGYLGEDEYDEAHAGAYWDAVFGRARELDDTRPLTFANVQYAGNDDPAFARADVIGLNRYRGWYDAPGQIERGTERLRGELDDVAARYGKPIAVWEFGADAMAGQHASYDQMFTEEYQADMIEAQLDVIEDHPACVGAHVWNLTDFMTAQHHRRVVVNRKGVFTRDRQPKMAAHMLRRRWA